MNNNEVTRKLSAILSADVQGYSRLMGDNEIETVKTITEYRKTVISLVKQYKGRVVDAPGDNVLAEFASVVDAVQCAVEIQNVLKVKNEDLPENRRMIFRIGVNLGDIIQEGDRIYGDGVNIAARIEGLADGGGICISGTAYDQIENKLALGYNFIGEHSVKNIAKPVRVYKVPMIPGDREEVKEKAVVTQKKPPWTALAIILALILAAGTFWYFYLRPAATPVETASKKATTTAPSKATPPALSEKPSVAVLPFDNMSENKQLGFFADGLTENIITGISKNPGLFVIARNSSFTYKGKPVKIQQVAKELGVQYVLEGSVQKAGDKVRITAQLIDAATGKHLWAEKYDRDIKDMFAIQDEITLKLMKTLNVELTGGGSAVIWHGNTNNLSAFEKYTEGMEYFAKGDVRRAAPLFQEAIALDPNYSTPYTMLGWINMFGVWLGLTPSPEKALAQASQLAQKAISLNASSGYGRSLLAKVYMTERRFDEAIAEGKKAVAVDPNSYPAHIWLGCIYSFAGEPEEGLQWINKAFRMNPKPDGVFFITLAMTYNILGQYDKAIEIYKKILQVNPNELLALIGLTEGYSLSGRIEEARKTAKEVLRIHPGFSAEYYVKAMSYKKKEDNDRFLNALHQAGLK